MSAHGVHSSYFVAGGTLPRSVPSYVVRSADEQIYEALSAGEFAYVLTSRQLGKSSLMVRTAARLRADGATVILLDLTALGQNLTAAEWYYSLAEMIAEHSIGVIGFRQLAREWAGGPPLQFWLRTIEAAIANDPERRLVIFIDEIDAVLSLPFSTDEFFASIRGLYNRRSEILSLERLSFCLLGVAAPSDLIRDTRTTPFNIGRRVELADFSHTEASLLAAGLNGEESERSRLLGRVLYWTGGHPYLTQRFCQALSSNGHGSPEDADADAICKALFLSGQSRSQDDNLLFVRERLLKARVDTSGLLELYRRVLRGKRVISNERNELQNVLRLSGIVTPRKGVLQVRNRIYKSAFDAAWVAENLPGAEARRQRAAFRRGFALASLAALCIIGVMTYLAYSIQRQRDENRRQLYVADIGLAQQAWEAHDFYRVRALLRSHIPTKMMPDLRGLEWYGLWNLVTKEQPLMAIDNVQSWKNATILSPEQQRIFGLVTGDELVEFDANTGQRLRSVMKLPARSRPVCATANGLLLTSTLSGNDIKIWDFGTGSLIKDYAAPGLSSARNERGEYTGTIAGCSLDGQRVAFSNGTSLWIVRTTDWQPVAQHDAGTVVREASFSPDGRLLAFTTRTTAEVWSIDFSEQLAKLPANQPGSLTFSPDSTCVAWADYDAIHVVNLKTKHSRLFAHSGLNGDLAFSPNGRYLASSVFDSIRIWDLRGGEALKTIEPYPGTAQVAFFPDSRRLLAIGRSGGVSVWDAATPESGMSDADEIYTLAFSPDGTRFVSGGNDGQLLLWNATTQQRIGRIAVNERIEHLDFVAPQRVIVNSSHQLGVWDLGSRKMIQLLARSPDGIVAAVSADKTKLAVADKASRKASLTSLANGQTIADWRLRSDPIAVAIDDAGEKVAVGFSDEDILIFQLGREPLQLPGPLMTRRLLFTHSGRLIAGSDDGSVRVWDPRQVRKLAILDAHRAPVKGLALSPDGTRLISTSDDGTLRIWDTATFQPIVTYQRSQKSIEAAAFSSDGRFLAAAGDDGQVSLWQVGRENVNSCKTYK